MGIRKIYRSYEDILMEAGLNRFIMSVKQWVSRTNSKGIIAKAGRYGGTYAYKDIVFEFVSWVSPQFKLYLIKNELICISNMENINAVLIEDGMSQRERLIKLNKIAIHQMSILEEQTTSVLK